MHRKGTSKQRVFIYVRISRDRIGAGIGVERQERECRELAEQLGFIVSMDLHDVYATTLPSGNASVRPPQSPTTSTASGLGGTDDSGLRPNVTSALLFAFPGPIPLKMRTTSFATQCAGARESAAAAIFRTGSPSIGEAAKI